MRTATTARLPTARNADAVAWCPYFGLEHMLACGCYEHDDAVQPARRHGCLTLLSADISSGDLSELSASSETGVLDCSWLPASARAPHLLAAATSDCDARLFPLQEGSDAVALGSACATMACADAGDACMALDWGIGGSAPRLHPPLHFEHHWLIRGDCNERRCPKNQMNRISW